MPVASLLTSLPPLSDAIVADFVHYIGGWIVSLQHEAAPSTPRTAGIGRTTTSRHHTTHHAGGGPHATSFGMLNMALAAKGLVRNAVMKVPRMLGMSHPAGSNVPPRFDSPDFWLYRDKGKYVHPSEFLFKYPEEVYKHPLSKMKMVKEREAILTCNSPSTCRARCEHKYGRRELWKGVKDKMKVGNMVRKYMACLQAVDAREEDAMENYFQ